MDENIVDETIVDENIVDETIDETLPVMPTRFLKQITSKDISNLKNPYLKTVANKVNNEVNEIKYRVLQAINLEATRYEHPYYFEYDSTNIEITDYFTNILDNLKDIFPNATIKYTSSESNDEVLYSTSSDASAYNSRISSDQRRIVKNTIIISWN
jgi:hypothetical protein